MFFYAIIIFYIAFDRFRQLCSSTVKAAQQRFPFSRFSREKDEVRVEKKTKNTQLTVTLYSEF